MKIIEYSSLIIYIYLLVKFRKLVLAIFIGHYGLQTLKVSGDLETIDVIVVEIPWNTPVVLSVKKSI